MRIPASQVRPDDVVLGRRILSVTTHPDNPEVTRLITDDGGTLDTYCKHELSVERREGE